MNAIPTFPLYVDHRVGSVELAKHIAIPLEVTTLDYGDFAFMGFGQDDEVWNFGIERKTISDLVNSIETGRLSGHQLIGLTREYHVVYLLVEGDFAIVDGDIFVYSGKKLVPVGGRNRKIRFKYSTVAGYINTLQVAVGVKFWYTKNPKESGAWIRNTYLHWQKEWNDHRSHLQFHEYPSRRRDLARLVPPSLERRILKELKGVGWERAENIAEMFPSMEAIMSATVEDFATVPGVGKATAKSMWEELHARK